MPIGETFARRLRPIVGDLAASYGTPFHIYDEAGIVETHEAMAAAFGDWPFRQYFAVKALPNPAILSALRGAGSGLDCSSPAELALARDVGAEGEDIVFTSNNTTAAEYEAALAMGALITFDDRRHLARARRLPEIVAFRVSPDDARTLSPLMGGEGRTKFGVPRGELAAAYAEARDRGATRFGLHGMTCANERETGKAVRAAEALVATAAALEREVGIPIEYVNFGGGLGIPYRPGERPVDFPAYAAAIRTALASAFPGRRPRVVMECGRYVTGPHGVLVARVINRMRKSREVVGLDASMSALMRPGFYDTAYHHISLPFAGERPAVTVDVVGSLCESTDRFALDRSLPDPQEGDLVYLHDTGAHGHAMGFTYNGRLRPPELMLAADGTVLEIRRAETFEDYVATVRWRPVAVPAGGGSARASVVEEESAP